MGLDVYTHIVLGMRVPQGHDFTMEVKEPLQCAHGHPRPSPDMVFCPKDGTSFAERTSRVPKPEVAAYIAKQGWSDISGLYADGLSSLGVCIHTVNTIQSCEGVKSKVLALGVTVTSTESHRRMDGPDVTTVDLANPELEGLIQSAAIELGLPPQKMEAFVCRYFSF